jgi:hypothetical protein
MNIAKHISHKVRDKFHSFDGDNIVAYFDGKPIGQLQSITYSDAERRSSGPIYTLGSTRPRSWGVPQ